jgi:Rieske 2Fe-2S family protein
VGRADDLAEPGAQVAANWMIVAENCNECCHCPSIHPEVCAVTPPDSGGTYRGAGAWVGGSMDLRAHATTMSLDGRGTGAPLPRLDADARREVRYLDLFPGLLLSLHPAYVLTDRLEPLAPDRTVVECTWLFADPDVDPGEVPLYDSPSSRVSGASAK